MGEVRSEDVSDNLKSNAAKIRRTHVIDAKVKAEFFGHSYFYSSPAVSSDLILMLRDNRDPGQTNGRPLIQLGSNFWRIDDEYPNMLSE